MTSTEAPRESLAIHRYEPTTEAETVLHRRSTNRSPLFVAVATDVAFSSKSEDLGDQPYVIDLKPEARRKVTGNSEWKFGRAEVLATDLWPVAVYWALTGGQLSDISLDTGVCAHEVPNPLDPHGEPALVVTLMSTWDHHWYGRGLVWSLDGNDDRFEKMTELPWLYTAQSTVTVPRIGALPVTAADLPFRPLECRPDDVMLSVGAEPLHKEGLPKRGPHVAFDPDYGCGRSGGTFMLIGSSIYAINDSFVEPEHRGPEFNVRTTRSLRRYNASTDNDRTPRYTYDSNQTVTTPDLGLNQSLA